MLALDPPPPSRNSPTCSPLPVPFCSLPPTHSPAPAGLSSRLSSFLGFLPRRERGRNFRLKDETAKPPNPRSSLPSPAPGSGPPAVAGLSCPLVAARSPRRLPRPVGRLPGSGRGLDGGAA